MKNFFITIKLLKNNKLFILYSIAYGITGLIIPLGVQFLVNNLALSGIWVNISAFLFFIVLGLSLSQTLKHSILVIIESIQRELFLSEIEKWAKVKNPKYTHFYFEIFNLMKTFSKSYASIIELILVTLFGLSTIILFHPIFLLASALIIFTLWRVYKNSGPALQSSIAESDQKYFIFESLKSEGTLDGHRIRNFLEARNHHFSFIRKNSIKISLLTVLVQSFILVVGCYLIDKNQLSLGQLVSAEIIISGIFIAINKLPLTLEAVYDFETSKFKLKKALGAGHE